jgi:hypothetical protein
MMSCSSVVRSELRNPSNLRSSDPKSLRANGHQHSHGLARETFPLALPLNRKYAVGQFYFGDFALRRVKIKSALTRLTLAAQTHVDELDLKPAITEVPAETVADADRIDAYDGNA